MIVAAPPSRAAAITCRPTPPQPITHTRSPIATRAAWVTAPNPVTTPQPSSAACHSGNVAWDRDHAGAGDDRVLGEAGDGQAVLEHRAVGSAQP